MRIAAIRRVLLVLWVVLLATWSSRVGSLPQPQDDELSISLEQAAAESLATVFARRAAEAAGLEPITSVSLGLASELFRVADDLDPDQPEVLRGHLALANLAEDAPLRSQLLERLARLEPGDERIRLARINDVLTRYSSAEDLIAAYLIILKDENIRKLGGPVASRLATGLAVLYERQGDSDSYAQWISRASALDQSNKEAAALAAGYFQQHVDDPFGQAELLVNLLLADPMDLSTQAALGRHLLEHGAFTAAVRMYELAVNTQTSLGRLPSPDLLADLAIAEWASGNPDEAMTTIRRYQQVLDEAVRMRAWNENPELGPTERAALTATLPATLAVVHLALLEMQDQLAADAALVQLLTSITTSLEENQEIAPEERHAALLTQAWLASWFGHDPVAIQSFLDQAAGDTPVNDVARARFEGWIALRSNELDRADRLLSPIAEHDLPAMAALALVRVAQGEIGEASRLFNSIAARDPGSVLGVWAREHASSISDSSPAAPPFVAKMNELIDSIPAGIDRIPTDRQFGLSLRVEPVDQLYHAFDAVPVRLVVTNHTGLPIGISPEGPLRPNLILQPEISAPTEPRFNQAPPSVIDIGRRLRLRPREKLEVIIDLRRHAVGEFINASGTGGASVQIRGILNPFSASQQVIEAGPLGYVTRSRELRVDGVRVTPDWVNSISASLRDGGLIGISDLGLLLHAIHGTPRTDRPRVSPDTDIALTAAMAALLGRFDSLDAVVQAWIVATVPSGSEALSPIIDRARAINSPLVHMSYLVNHLDGATDPLLEQALASSDPQVVMIADLLKQMLEQQAAVEEMRGQQTQQQNSSRQGQGGR